MLTLFSEIVSVIVGMFVLAWLFKAIAVVILATGAGVIGLLLILKVCG
jgi:hypothetical protein